MSEEDWYEPEQLQADYAWAFRRRLYEDMIQVLDRGLHMPIYIESEGDPGTLTHEWVNKAIRDELVEANDKIRAYEEQFKRQRDLLKTAGKHIVAARPYMDSLLKPPPPWKEFGYHAQFAPNVPDVVFWGEDGTGLPIWERLKEEDE